MLIRIFNYDADHIQKWTLGRTTRALRESGFRDDFIALLEEFVQHRNYIAHEYLVNDALFRRILGRDIGRFKRKHLERGIFAVEQEYLSTIGLNNTARGCHAVDAQEVVDASSDGVFRRSFDRLS